MDLYEIIPKDTIDAIEESIQRKRGSDAPIDPSEMPLAIDTIPSSVDGTDVPVGGIYFTKPDSNGNPTECYIIGYSPNQSYSWTNQIGFAYFPYLKKVEFINCKRIASIGSSAFRNCSSLTTINLPNSITSISVYAFDGCRSLTDVTVESGFNCNNLNLSVSTRYTAETIVSWLEALADRTGQTTFTLTIGATNLNKLTAEQKAIATNKNWTLA